MRVLFLRTVYVRKSDNRNRSGVPDVATNGPDIRAYSIYADSVGRISSQMVGVLDVVCFQEKRGSVFLFFRGFGVLAFKNITRIITDNRIAYSKAPKIYASRKQRL